MVILGGYVNGFPREIMFFAENLGEMRYRRLISGSAPFPIPKSAIRDPKMHWAHQDSNLGPRDYESPALTAELQARVVIAVKHSEPLMTNPESFSDALTPDFFASRPLVKAFGVFSSAEQQATQCVSAIGSRR